MADLVVVGGCNMDVIARAQRLPSAGETVLGERYFLAPGGKGSNQAVAAARLGARVEFVGRLGSDDFGIRLRAMLEQEGVGVRFLGTDPELPSGVALITVDDRGENTIVVAPGANAGLRPEHVADTLPVLRRARLVVLQLESPLPALSFAAEQAAAAGVPVLLSAGPARPVPDELLARVAVLVANRAEIAALAEGPGGEAFDLEQAARLLLERGVGVVIATLGPDGALMVGRGERHHVPAFPVQVVDTVGAGDAFVAGVAVALVEGRPPLDAVRLGNACGALASTRPGAQPALPHRDEVERFLSEQTL